MHNLFHPWGARVCTHAFKSTNPALVRDPPPPPHTQRLVHPANPPTYMPPPPPPKRLVHPASGRSYNIYFNPPKVEGKDDVRGKGVLLSLSMVVVESNPACMLSVLMPNLWSNQTLLNLFNLDPPRDRQHMPVAQFSTQPHHHFPPPHS